MTKSKPRQDKPKPLRRWPLHLHHRSSQLVIFIVLIGLVLISHFGRAHLNSSAAQVRVSPNQVSITVGGFSPPVLSVKTGSPVTWSNNDTRPHQVVADMSADNPAPLGFDSSLILRTGDTYTYSFIHPGTYIYYDQLSPGSPGGTIIVQ